MTKKLMLVLLLVGAVSVTRGQEPAPTLNELLFEAARAGDVARIEAALAKGASVNATSRYNMTPLIFAAGSGRFEAVKVLVARGANVNAEDSFYRFSAGEVAVMNGHVDIALFLLQNGRQGADDLVIFSVQSDNAALLKAALAASVTRQGVQSALGAAERLKRDALVPLLKTRLDSLPAATQPPAPVQPAASPTAQVGTQSVGAPAAPDLTPIARNDMKEVIMATPAISDGVICGENDRPRVRDRAMRLADRDIDDFYRAIRESTPAARRSQ